MRLFVLSVLAVTLAAVSPRAQEPEKQEPPAAEAPTQLSPQERERLTEEASQAEATEIASEDAALSERLRSIFAAVESFRGIDVAVTAGIVVLRGDAPTRDAIDKAGELAGKLGGVLLVVNEVVVQKELGRRIDTAWDGVVTRMRDAMGSLPILGVALVMFAAFWLLARLLRDASFLYRLLSKRVLLQDLLRQTVFVVVLLGGLVATLRLVDATAVIGTVLGAAGVVGLALGFAFRNIVENYLAGILLAIRQPFRARDVVNIDGAAGTVLRMTASETTLMDADGNHLRLPNAMVFNGKVLNYTRNPLRRFTVAVDVGTDVDLDRAQEHGVATLLRMNGVIDDPGPSASVTGLGDSSVRLEFYGWVDQRKANYFKVASESRRLIKVGFDEAGVDMPAPTYNVLLEEPAAALADRALRPARDVSPADAGPAPEEINVAVEDDVSGQVEDELARTDEPDLLTEGDR